MINAEEKENHAGRRRISSGSAVFDSILGGGGVPQRAIVDVFGAAGTGKTQFSFQCALYAALDFISQKKVADASTSGVAFVDCSGSFRPERIEEIARLRGLSRSQRKAILDTIYSIRARNVREQKRASELFASGERFSSCALLVVDDVTSNFTLEAGSSDEEVIRRQFLLASYIRELNYIALKKQASVIITNSVRSRGGGVEAEAGGEIIPSYVLFRIHLKKIANARKVAVIQPHTTRGYSSFEILPCGIP